MRKFTTALLSTITLSLAAGSLPACAQTFPTGDPIIEQIWSLGMENSQAYALSQALLDPIGPRLTGSPEYNAAIDWLLGKYQEWGISARREQYGTWDGWKRGITHIDLVEPRVRTLEGITLAWSPGTVGDS